MSINIGDFLNTRNEYIALIKKELLGPGSEISIPDAEHELISDSPHNRYSVGILFPRENSLNAENDDSMKPEAASVVQTEDEDIEPDISADDESTDRIASGSNNDDGYLFENSNLDEEISLAAQNMPSSMGITFMIKGNPSVINCDVSFASYRKAGVPDCRIPYSPVKPDKYCVPEEFSPFVFFDNEERCLKLQAGGITTKQIRALKERHAPDMDEFGIIDAMYKLYAQLQRGHIRIPHNASLSLEFGESDYIDNCMNIDDTHLKMTALRRRVDADISSVTLMLVNDDTGKATGTNCIFQPMISVKSENNAFVFIEYAGSKNFSLMDAEEQSLDLQYRNKKAYGTGLGTSAGWDIADNGTGVIFSNFFPDYEVPGMDFALPADADVDNKALSMKYLSDLNNTAKEAKISHLKTLIKVYKTWIDGLSSTVEGWDKTTADRYRTIALRNISGCLAAYERMASGIDSLENDSDKWNAFQLANRAMFMQRVHLHIQESTADQSRFADDEELTAILDKIEYSSDTGLTVDRFFWRPFQLAFILMSVESVTTDNAPDRDIVDLIWFPTGGGKTEAYLGLTAMTIFYRRLKHLSVSSGTTVIMRYTLRLLAAQQFTRASALICACEYIRRDASQRRPKYTPYDLGNDRITIGLWIGSEHTPNKNAKAKEYLKELLSARAANLAEAKEKYNKFQVLKCPWCGTKLIKEKDGNNLIGTFGYRMKNNSRFELFCPQESCYFNQAGSLPVQIVDEELYREPPTLLFGTVDKFAMLPWKSEIGSFFAVGTVNRCPELIIQDELHLISGPLGTMVGLYETVVDKLCSSKGTAPKIVASTATIRRAQEQCSALYNRKVSQFPHPGLDADDSFFARESVIDYASGSFGRKYIGLMPSGKTKAMMQVRTIAALLQTMNTMDIPDDIKDKYWTVTAYFNSLKDLGKCTTLVDDDIKDFIKRTAFRLGKAKNARKIGRADELTSRVSTTELNETLDKLEKLSYSQENEKEKRFASNVLLATNMISVGIDVARLNVMVLVGQPKLTSEYIQASSRIGRTFPGVAFALYDGSKSRDRSHFEQFIPYHEAFYKFVEPTGATPFSKPALNRALHAVVIALLRFEITDLASEKSAAKFTREQYSQFINDLRGYIADRGGSIAKTLRPDAADERDDIAAQIDECLDKWERRASGFNEGSFYFGDRYMVMPPEEGKGRLMKPFNTNPFDPAIDTMTSMRNIDTAIKGNVLIWEEKK